MPDQEHQRVRPGGGAAVLSPRARPARPALAAARRPTMRWGTTIVDHPRSYSHGPPAVRVDNTHQLQAAARELEAVALHEQARHLAKLHATLTELYRRDGIQITDTELDAQADHLALL